MFSPKRAGSLQIVGVATSIALWNRYTPSCPSLSSSALCASAVAKHGSNRFSVPALQFSLSIQLERVTASTLGLPKTSLFEDLLYRIAWNLELRAPASYHTHRRD